MKIAVISDTHTPAFTVPHSVFDRIKGVDVIIHAGDLCRLKVLDQLKTVADVHAVFGNQDEPEVIGVLPERLDLDLLGFRIAVIHGHQYRTALTTARVVADTEPRPHCVIFGHSHHAYGEMYKTVLLFNPGSPTWGRGGFVRSFGILKIDDAISHYIEPI